MGVSDSRQNEVLIKNTLINQIPLSIPSVSKSVCKIECNNKISSGFLIKFFKQNQDFFCLMTTGHAITSELIRQRKKITFYYDSGNKVKKIDLFPDKRYIKDFKDFNIDATVIEIIPSDEIQKDNFLIPSVDYMYNFNAF